MGVGAGSGFQGGGQRLSRTLGALTRGLRVVAAERPLSAAPSRLSRYVIDDNYLRFWLRFVAGRMELILRGRGALAAAEVAAADEAPLVGVARTEVSGEVDVALVAEDLLAAWR